MADSFEHDGRVKNELAAGIGRKSERPHPSKRRMGHPKNRKVKNRTVETEGCGTRLRLCRSRKAVAAAPEAMLALGVLAHRLRELRRSFRWENGGWRFERHQFSGGFVDTSLAGGPFF